MKMHALTLPGAIPLGFFKSATLAFTTGTLPSVRALE